MNSMIPTIGEMLAGSAARVPERRALVCDDQELSYRELNTRVNQTVRGFLQQGITGGDRAALLLHNRIELAVLLMGLARAGIVGIPLNYRLHPGELSAVLHQSGATVLFVGEELEPLFTACDIHASSVRSVMQVKTSSAKGDGFWEICRGRPDSHLPAAAGPGRDSFIIYTSGTTGFPRGVVLTHGNHFWNAVNYSVAYGMTETDVELGLSPLFHSSTLGRMITCFFVGAAFVTSRQFHPQTAMELIARNRVTSISQSPTMYAALCHLTGADRYDTASVKRVVSGAAPLFPALRKELTRLFPGAGVYDLYGLTEAAPGVSILTPHDPPEKQGERIARIEGHRPVEDLEGRHGEPPRLHVIAGAARAHPRIEPEVGESVGALREGGRRLFHQGSGRGVIAAVREGAGLGYITLDILRVGIAACQRGD